MIEIDKTLVVKEHLNPHKGEYYLLLSDNETIIIVTKEEWLASEVGKRPYIEMEEAK